MYMMILEIGLFVAAFYASLACVNTLANRVMQGFRSKIFMEILMGKLEPSLEKRKKIRNASVAKLTAVALLPLTLTIGDYYLFFLAVPAIIGSQQFCLAFCLSPSWWFAGFAGGVAFIGILAYLNTFLFKKRSELTKSL